VQLEGRGPWALHGGAADADSDVQLIFTPGHTAGCVSLLHRPDRALFTGDHLAHSARLGRLTIFRAYNWHSVAQQLRSAAALRDVDFLHLLPGHGRRTSFADAADRRRQLDALLAAEGYAAAGASA
jgi:glyoxylase-like metal-dependent hydrolase (beta-lactamase superfamily II)